MERIVINVIIKRNAINLPLGMVKIPTISGSIWDGANMALAFPHSNSMVSCLYVPLLVLYSHCRFALIHDVPICSATVFPTVFPLIPCHNLVSIRRWQAAGRKNSCPVSGLLGAIEDRRTFQGFHSYIYIICSTTRGYPKKRDRDSIVLIF